MEELMRYVTENGRVEGEGWDYIESLIAEMHYEIEQFPRDWPKINPNVDVRHWVKTNVACSHN